MTFNDLNLNNALRNALEDINLTEPTPIQEKAFPVIMSGKDVVGIAQTGTGKTFAYLLPLLRQLEYSKEAKTRVLIVVPTRELVVQVVGEALKLTRYMTVRVAGVYGGTNINTQKKLVEAGVDLLVATPGRLVDLALTRALRLKWVKKLVIDEVDEMMNLGFRPQLNTLLDLVPDKRQTLLFSATMTEEVEALIETFFNRPVKIEAAISGTPVEKINQYAYPIPNFLSKASLLQHLLQNEELEKVLVFIGTKKLADRLHEFLEPEFGENVAAIHSNKSQNLRLNTVKRLHAGELRILIATDIMARGLDISEVSHVINFDTPDNPENYMHRIGRTGRAEKEGIAITFVNEKEKPHQVAIEDLMQRKITMLPLPEEVSTTEELIPEEMPVMAGDKHYFKAPKQESQGAFHEKKAKNMKVNRAHEKRKARKLQKKKARRGPKRK